MAASLWAIAACGPRASEDLELQISQEETDDALATTQAAALTRTPTLTPTPSTTPTPGPAVLGEDDFSDPSSGWKISNLPDSAYGYTDGKYSIFLATFDEIGSSFYPGSFTHVGVEGTAAIDTGSAVFGLACRVAGESSYYVGLISGTMFGIFLLTEDGLEPLARGEFEAFLLEGSEETRLGFTCIGSELTLFVNDMRVGAASHSALSEGSVGFVVVSLEAGTEVLFDDFLLLDLTQN